MPSAKVRRFRLRRISRRGGALVLVTISLGVASVLSLALLSSSSLQAQVGASATAVTTADHLAESGINIAAYYLQHPERYLGSKPSGYYPGEASINLSSSAAGTISTAVSYDATNKVYTVVATGTVPSKGPLPIARTTTAQLKVNSYAALDPVRSALVLNADLDIASNLNVVGGPEGIRSTGTVRVLTGAKVTGDVMAKQVTSLGTGQITGTTTVLSATQLAELADNAVGAVSTTVTNLLGNVLGGGATTTATPTAKLVDMAKFPDLKTYRWTDPVTGVTGTYNAVLVSSKSLSGKTLGPTSSNPAGVFYAQDDIAINHDTTINGTLFLAPDVDLEQYGGTRLNITAATGFPALVADMFRMNGTTQGNLNGVVAARQLQTSGLGSGTLSIRGALLLSDAAEPIASGYKGSINVQFDASLALAKGFEVNRIGPPDRTLQILSWNE